MNGRLLYHPHLIITKQWGITAYSDNFNGNQDPYIWQEVFLHSYCHMGQMREGFNMLRIHHEVDEGDVNFWITSDTRDDYSKLYCDLVFVVAHKDYWETPNYIAETDPLIESKTAFDKHYSYPEKGEHLFIPKKLAKGYKRFTLKANPLLSFQPQEKNGSLFNILPSLLELGINKDALEHVLGKKGSWSRPLLLEAGLARNLYELVRQRAPVRRTGADFEKFECNRAI